MIPGPMHAAAHYEILDERFRAYVMTLHAPVERLATGFRWTEGPVWFADFGMLLFSDIPNNRIMRWSAGGDLAPFREGSDYANGNTRDRQGRLVTCSHGRRALLRTEYDGTITVLADRYQGRRLNSPNDVVVKSDDTIWFTDPHYGIATDYEGIGRTAEELPCQVYRFDPADGDLSVVADDFACPNGLAFSPDETRLYISETGRADARDPAQHIRAFDVVDGRRLMGGAVFHEVRPGCSDGFRCDVDGNVWSSAADGVHCITPGGDVIGKIWVPEIVSNVAFGGRHRSRLFITATTSLYAVFLNQRGL